MIERKTAKESKEHERMFCFLVSFSSSSMFFSFVLTVPLVDQQCEKRLGIAK